MSTVGVVLALTGFALVIVGMINPFVQRATFLGKEGPLKPVVANTLLGTGFALVMAGLVIRAV